MENELGEGEKGEVALIERGIIVTKV